MYGCRKDCLILIPLRLPQISCFTLSLKCFSSDSDTWPDVGIRPLLQFPCPLRAGPVLLTLLFFPLVPSSYQVLHDSICSFPLVRYSCPLSASILHGLLHLKVYSWCIHAEINSTPTYSSDILFYLCEAFCHNNFTLWTRRPVVELYQLLRSPNQCSVQELGK